MNGPYLCLRTTLSTLTLPASSQISHELAVACICACKTPRTLFVSRPFSHELVGLVFVQARHPERAVRHAPGTHRGHHSPGPERRWALRAEQFQGPDRQAVGPAEDGQPGRGELRGSGFLGQCHSHRQCTYKRCMGSGFGIGFLAQGVHVYTCAGEHTKVLLAWHVRCCA